MMSNRKNNLMGTSLTQADINIMKLVDSTQRQLKTKQFHYKQLEKYCKFSDDSKTNLFITNYINGDKSKRVKLDQRVLGKFI